MNKKILFIIMLIPLLNQLSNSYIPLRNGIYIPFILIIAIVFFSKRISYSIFNKKNLIINRISMLLFLSYSISPILGFTIFKYTPVDNIIYIFLFYIFILFLYIIGKIFGDNYKYILFLKYIFIGNSFILLINLIFNIKEIEFINFNTILTENRGIRADFGINHPNLTAMYILTEMLLIYLLIIKEKKKYTFGIVFLLILLIFLVATGSRTAILVFLVFIFLQIYSKLTNKINKYIRLSLFLAIISIIFILLIYKIDFNNILTRTSGRNVAFINNIEFIKIYGNIFTGIAPSNISTLMTKITLDYADNWYVVQIIQFGLIGLCIIIICILYLAKIFYYNNNKLCLNLLISFLFYSSSERVFFVPGVTLSFVIWSIFFINISKKNYI